MKYKQYVVYSAINFLGFWFMVAAQFTALDRFLPVNNTRLALEMSRHDMGWCIGWLVTTATNTLFQIWYWRKEKRETNLHKPKTRIPPVKLYKQK